MPLATDNEKYCVAKGHTRVARDVARGDAHPYHDTGLCGGEIVRKSTGGHCGIT